MYLFEEIESESGLSGFSSGVEFYELPFEMLANRSNIGERGKWLFRVDGIVPLHCPAGTLNPPLCQKGSQYWILVSRKKPKRLKLQVNCDNLLY